MSRRFQFSLKWLFVAMLAVGCFFGGMTIQKQMDKPFTVVQTERRGNVMRLKDGSTWMKIRPRGTVPEVEE